MISTQSETRLDLHRPDRPTRGHAVPAVPGYHLIEVVGRGGLGVVYLAEHLASQMTCAVKIIRPDRATEARSVMRFQREIDVLRRLSHPAIVRIFHSGPARYGSHHFAMEYVAGPDLEEKVRRDGPLAAAHVMAIIRTVCAALEEVHSLDIVHNDIKPSNIIAVGLGSRYGSVKLIDFGLAQSVGGDRRIAGRSAEIGFAGSPLYASPESYSGAVDHRSDIYSLGATAYHLLTGRPVFDEDRPLAAMKSHLLSDPEPLARLRPDIDRSVAESVMKCLMKDPADRFQTVAELSAALVAAHWQDVSAEQPAVEPWVDHGTLCPEACAAV